MSAHTSPNAAFNASANALEGARQVAVSAATGATAQATARSAEVSYYRSLITLAQQQNISPAPFTTALRSLGWQT
jgi:hypothetical protein